MIQKKVAQIWVTYPDGYSCRWSDKYYSKIGIAENIAKELNEKYYSEYFVRFYSLEFVGDITA